MQARRTFARVRAVVRDHPVLPGRAVGAIAAGDVKAGGTGDALGWVGPLPLLVGVLFIASCAYIAAVFLLDECRRAGDEELAAYFKRRSIVAAIVTGHARRGRARRLPRRRPHVFDGLVDEGLPFLILSATAGR